MQGEFVMVPVAVLDAGLSMGARCLYQEMRRYVRPDQRTVYPNQQTLADALDVNVRTVRRWLGELTESGCITRTELPDRAIAYTVNDAPAEDWKNRIVVSASEKPDRSVRKTGSYDPHSPAKTGSYDPQKNINTKTQIKISSSSFVDPSDLPQAEAINVQAQGEQAGAKGGHKGKPKPDTLKDLTAEQTARYRAIWDGTLAPLVAAKTVTKQQLFAAQDACKALARLEQHPTESIIGCWQSLVADRHGDYVPLSWVLNRIGTYRHAGTPAEGSHERRDQSAGRIVASPNRPKFDDDYYARAEKRWATNPDPAAGAGTGARSALSDLRGPDVDSDDGGRSPLPGVAGGASSRDVGPAAGVSAPDVRHSRTSLGQRSGDALAHSAATPGHDDGQSLGMDGSGRYAAVAADDRSERMRQNAARVMDRSALVSSGAARALPRRDRMDYGPDGNAVYGSLSAGRGTRSVLAATRQMAGAGRRDSGMLAHRPTRRSAVCAADRTLSHSTPHLLAEQRESRGMAGRNGRTAGKPARGQCDVSSCRAERRAGLSGIWLAIVVTDATIDRLPPNDLAAEQAVCGSILIDPDTLPSVAFLQPSDFFHPRHTAIFTALLRIYDRGARIDLVTLAHELEQRGELDIAGGPSYLGQIVSETPTSLHIEFYAGIVHRASLARQLLQAAGQIAALAYNAGERIEPVIAECVDLVARLADKRITTDARTLTDVLNAVYDSLITADPAGRPLATGFVDIDRILGGMHGGEMVILAARPGFGKSALALQIARNAAEFGRVVVFSLEMAAEALATRLLAAESSVPHFRIVPGDVSEGEQVRLLEAIGTLSDLPILICDTPTQRTGEIRGIARRLHQQEPLRLVVIDYVQLMDGASSASKRDGRQQEVAEISHALKSLARELSVPVLALAQLNRNVEQRAGQRPMLSDLRDSGSLEQDADSVVFLHRPDAYTTEDDWGKRHPTEPYPRGVVEVIVAKHRNGPTGQTSLLFQGETTRFLAHQKGS